MANEKGYDCSVAKPRQLGERISKNPVTSRPSPFKHETKPPTEEDKWVVAISAVNETVHVQIVKGCTVSSYYTKYVNKPNWLDKLRGITFEKKVENAMRFAQHVCNEWNAQEETAQQVVDKLRERLKGKETVIPREERL